MNSRDFRKNWTSKSRKAMGALVPRLLSAAALD